MASLHLKSNLGWRSAIGDNRRDLTKDFVACKEGGKHKRVAFSGDGDGVGNHKGGVFLLDAQNFGNGDFYLFFFFNLGG